MPTRLSDEKAQANLKRFDLIKGWAQIGAIVILNPQFTTVEEMINVLSRLAYAAHTEYHTKRK